MGTLKNETRPGIIYNSTIAGINELTSAIKYNPVKGFLLTNGGIILLLILIIGAGVLMKSSSLSNGYTGVITEIMPTAEPTVEAPVAPPPVPKGLPASVQVRTEQVIAEFVPAPDIQITKPVDVADFGNIGNSLSNTTGVLINGAQIDDAIRNQNTGAGTGNASQTTITEQTDDETIFVNYEEQPAIDMSTLYSNLQYPEVLKRAQIEGKVVISIYIGKDGNVIKTKINESSNALFAKAATEAALKAVYKPAVLNKKPVNSWLTIPIRFVLK